MRVGAFWEAATRERERRGESPENATTCAFLLKMCYQSRILFSECRLGRCRLVDISYTSRKMQKDCSSEKKMAARWGTLTARRLMSRLTEMEAAVTLEDLRNLPQARCHERKGKGCLLSVDLAQPYRLVFQPDHDPFPVKPDGGLDWTRVTRILILEVDDPH